MNQEQELAVLTELTRMPRTVLVVDMVESVRLIERYEEPTIRRWRTFVDEAVRLDAQPLGGRLVKSLGDGMMLEFMEPRPAVQCALAMQARLAKLNEPLAADERMDARIGIHAADVIVEQEDIYGAGVNLAARVATLAGPGEIVVTPAVRDQVVDGLDAQTEDLGECYLKHLSGPVRAYRVQAQSPVDQHANSDILAPELRSVVAVLPFENYQETTSKLGVGDIITDQLIGALSRIDSISVVSRLSTTAFRGVQASLEEIGRRLGANFVVSGRYWDSGGKLHAAVELASACDGAVLWSQTVSDREDAVLQSDSAFMLELVSGISQAIFAQEVRSAKFLALPNLASHTLLLASIGLLYRLSLADFRRARTALEVLHDRAPRHPSPLAWLARWHLFRVVQGWSDDREQDGKAALAYAKRALELDGESALALTMMGNVHTNFLRDLDAAECYYNQALAVNPNESLAWLQKANALSFRGDGNGALAHAEKAASLSPLDPSRHFYQSILASAALSAGNYEQAIGAAKTSIRLNTGHVSSYRVLAIALCLQGQLDEARAIVRHLRVVEPELTVASFVARSPGAKSGLAQKFGDALHRAGLPAGTVTHC
jgi:class 3 adenylate cyclase/tetratricopeptide (TPR) repeat protein